MSHFIEGTTSEAPLVFNNIEPQRAKVKIKTLLRSNTLQKIMQDEDEGKIIDIYGQRMSE